MKKRKYRLHPITVDVDNLGYNNASGLLARIAFSNKHKHNNWLGVFFIDLLETMAEWLDEWQSRDSDTKNLKRCASAAEHIRKAANALKKNYGTFK